MNPDIISDDEALRQVKKDMEDEIIREAFFDFTKGKRNWRAVVLSNAASADKKVVNSLDGSRLPVKLKVLDTLENIIPDPCDEKFSELQVKRLVSCFPTGYSTQPFHNRYSLPDFGQVVRCTFNEKGPPELGRHRGIQYSYKTDEETQLYDCKTRSFRGGMTSFTKGGASLLTYASTPAPIECGVSVPNSKRKRLPLTWANLGTLVDSGAFNSILTWIASGESQSGGYEAVNRGLIPIKDDDDKTIWKFLSGKGYSPIQHFKKNLVDMTVSEVRCTQKRIEDIPDRRGKCKNIKKYSDNNLHYLAVGKYQMIPQTLHGAIVTLKKTKGFDPDTQLFDANAQERFGVYLLMIKRRAFANYVIGNHDNACQAAHDLALEFASIGLQYERKGQKRGQPMAKGNKAKHSPESAYAEVKKIKQTLQALGTSTDAGKLIKKYKK